ncbi:MAG: 4Fe-4S binding protein [Planctomycetes bacterium]|nr:4Fe-4S binding protein [Planctomycetota bacterium]
MAKQIMPPAEFERSKSLDFADELLTADELKGISLFQSLKTKMPFEKFPGYTILRRCAPDRVLCEQAEAGSTAFYILTTEDVLSLRKFQLASIIEIKKARAEGETETDELQPFFRDQSDPELLEHEKKLSGEIEQLGSRIEQLNESDERNQQQLRQVAKACLILDSELERNKGGGLRRLARAIFGGGTTPAESRPGSIPIDGPTDIDSKSMEAPLYEGEMFGEMSCINRTPRSATVVATNDCYMLEMLQNLLNVLRRDPNFKQRMDETYKNRVMESQFRRLPLFENLTSEEFDLLRDDLELLEYPPGAVIFEEYEPSDNFYVIRSGVVKAVKNAWNLFRAAEFKDSHWSALFTELRTLSTATDNLSKLIWGALPDELRESLAAEQTEEISSSDRPAILAALNGLITGGAIHQKLGKKTKDIVEGLGIPVIRLAVNDFHLETARWTEIQIAVFHRLLLEHLFENGLPRRAESAGARNTLSYMGRGEFFGDIGVLLDQPRSATCIAYDHPESGFHQSIPDARTGAVPSRVELVRIGKSALQRLLQSVPDVKKQVEQIIAQRSASDRLRESDPGMLFQQAEQSPEFERLGLVQGQELMLIDLDRCTRCGACVDACVSTHRDGHSRLFLDGPRFENYLVPLTCRKCIDPVCMIGCPVGAITRGDNGEIQIKNWCIGCELCANQCPYGSIQMNYLDKPNFTAEQQQTLEKFSGEVKPISQRAVVCDLCSSLPGQSPACVYACPHDAALRVNSREFLLKSSFSDDRSNGGENGSENQLTASEVSG